MAVTMMYVDLFNDTTHPKIWGPHGSDYNACHLIYWHHTP